MSNNVGRIIQSIADTTLVDSGLVLVNGATGAGKTTAATEIAGRFIAAGLHTVAITDKLEAGIWANIGCEVVPSYVYGRINPLMLLAFDEPEQQQKANEEERHRELEWFSLHARRISARNPEAIVFDDILTLPAMKLMLAFAESGLPVVITMHAGSPEEGIERIHDSLCDASDYNRNQLINAARLSIHVNTVWEEGVKPQWEHTVLEVDAGYRTKMRTWGCN